MRPIVPWFVHSLDPPLGIRLRVGSVPDRRADGEPAKCPESLRPVQGVTPTGETQLPSPQRTLLLLPCSYGLIRQSQRPLLYFGFWPRWRSLRRLSPVPAARWTFPTLSPRIFPWMLDPIPRRSHSVLLPVSSAVSLAFPIRNWVGFPRIVRLKRLRAGRNFGAADISLCSGLQVCVAPQNVLRYLRTHRIC